MKTVPTFCRVCEPSCGLVAEVENDEIISLKPDRDHPVTKGFACHKGLATLDIHRDPDRLNHPMKREGDQFVRTSWPEALQGIADRIKNLQDRHGHDAIASYTGNPLAFNSTAGSAIGSFLVKNQIRKNFSSGTQDCANKFAGGEAIFGSSTIHPVPDIEHTDFLLIFGSNPRVSHMSFISIADPMAVLRDARKRGATIKFVDPRETESIKVIGDLVQVKADTDVYLMAALLHHLDRKDLFDQSYVQEHADNINGLREFIAAYSPEDVAQVVGIDSEQICELAESFAAADSAAVYMSTGVNMGRQGTVAYWLMFMLSLVTGNLGQRGGNVYARGFYPAAKAGRTGGQQPQYQETAFGEIRKMRGSLPGNLLADMILAEDNPIRGLVVISGNPLLSIGNSKRMQEALEKLEFMFVIDIYQNATATYADYLLPATDMYERADINLCGLGLQHQPFVQFTDYIVPPKAERKPEWWILNELEKTQGFEDTFDSDDPNLFGRLEHMMAHSDLSIESLKSEPSATAVLPPPQVGNFFSETIQTESGRVDCCPDSLAEARQRCGELFEELKAEPESQLKLISRRTNYMVNSWFHNIPSLKRPEHMNNPLYMHPEDARARNLGDGSTVSIANHFGKIESIVKLDDGLKPGTVAMTHGWGHSKTGMSVAKQNAGVNSNELLPSGPGSFEKISNQAFMTGIPVEVAAI